MADENSIGELFRRGDYYIVKRIREVTGQMAGTGLGSDTSYRIILYDKSKTRTKLYTTDDDGVSDVEQEFEDGDIITVPCNTIASGIDMTNQDGVFPYAAVVGLSRVASQINSGDETTIVGGGSWENITYYHYSFGTSTQYTMTSWKGGISYIFNCTLWNLHDTGSGDGNIHVVRAYDSGAGSGTINLYNCKIIADNDTAGLGEAAIAEDDCVINFYNCHLQVKDRTTPYSTTDNGIVNLYGCFIEEI